MRGNSMRLIVGDKIHNFNVKSFGFCDFLYVAAMPSTSRFVIFFFFPLWLGTLFLEIFPLGKLWTTFSP